MTYNNWFWKRSNVAVVKCIIPKGGVYYMNKSDEIVSDILVVTEWSISVVEISKLHKDECMTFQELFNELKERKSLRG